MNPSASNADALVMRDDHDGWAQLTLNRPDKLNALTVDLFRELREHIAALGDDMSGQPSQGALKVLPPTIGKKINVPL